MSTSAPSRQELVERILAELGPIAPSGLEGRSESRANSTSADRSRRASPHEGVVLAGHRAAGKTRILPLVAALLNREPIDLDQAIERAEHRKLHDWLTREPASFRKAERGHFQMLPREAVIAVGGGFLSHHADLLTDRTVVLVPITFETYRERLLADASRPRLRPELSLEEEIGTVWAEREKAHAKVPTTPLLDFLLGELARKP